MKGTEVPPALQIEPTNICNARCLCCSGWTNTRRKGFMEFDLFKRILDEASDIGVKRIHLYMHGEPLLHKQIVEMVAYIKTVGLSLTLATNGMLLSGEKMEALLGSGMTSADYLLLSVLGFSKETHEAIMRGINHETVVNNVKNAMAFRKQMRLKGPIIETVFYTMSENKNEEDRYRDYWGAIVDNARVARCSEQYQDYVNGDVHVPLRVKTCSHIWERMAIHNNGDVVMCHADINGEHFLGNIENRSITELWNGKQLSFIRNMHRERNFNALSICARCDW